MVPNVLRGSVENEEIGQSTIGTTKGTFSAGLPYGIFKVLLAIWLSSYDLASFFKILPQCVWLMMVLGQTKEHIGTYQGLFLLFCESWYVPIMFIFQPNKKEVWRTNGFHQVPVGQRVFRLMANRTN